MPQLCFVTEAVQMFLSLQESPTDQHVSALQDITGLGQHVPSIVEQSLTPPILRTPQPPVTVILDFILMPQTFPVGVTAVCSQVQQATLTEQPVIVELINLSTGTQP